MVHPDLLLSTMFSPCGARSSPAAKGQRGGDECWREAEHIDTGAPLTVTSTCQTVTAGPTLLQATWS